MKRQYIFMLLGLLVLIAAYFLFFNKKDLTQSNNITTIVEKGPFNIVVTATGELEAKKSKEILGPQSMRAAQIFETTIQQLVPEGTVVNEGDFVAQLDKTEIANKVADIQSEVDKINTQLDQAKIDTSIEMRALRDQLNNIKFSMEETKLQVELNRYEPQAVIRQKNIEYEKIQREFEQVRVKLGLTADKNGSKIKEIKTSLKQQLNKIDRLNKLANDFTVKAPADGMVIYSKSWQGKITAGSRLRAWDPVVAELPDLSEMISKTYVNEVDISKISAGQDAIINVDAFPDKTYSGTVTQVANIGEKLRDYDTKVFEVLISVNEQDSILRPAMTTGIEVQVNSFEDVVYIPLESLFADSIDYVFLKEGAKITKQQVLKGFLNETHAMILGGLNEGQEVLLNKPDTDKEYSVNYLEQDLSDKLLADFEKQKEEHNRILEQKKRNVVNDIETKAEKPNFIIF